MLQSIAAVFLGMAMFRGGRPNLPGTVLGVILLRLIDNGLNFTDIDDYLQSAISGARHRHRRAAAGHREAPRGALT